MVFVQGLIFFETLIKDPAGKAGSENKVWMSLYVHAALSGKKHF